MPLLCGRGPTFLEKKSFTENVKRKKDRRKDIKKSPRSAFSLAKLHYKQDINLTIYDRIFVFKTHIKPLNFNKTPCFVFDSNLMSYIILH